EDLVAADRHQLLDHHSARQDDVRALGPQAAHAAALARAERLQPRAQLRDLVAPQLEPVRRGPVLFDGAQEDAAEGAQAPAEADQRVARAGPGQHAEQPLARLAAQRLDLPGAGRIVTQEAQGRPDRAEGHARDPRDPSTPNARDLEAPAAQIDDRAA